MNLRKRFSHKSDVLYMYNYLKKIGLTRRRVTVPQTQKLQWATKPFASFQLKFISFSLRTKCKKFHHFTTEDVVVLIMYLLKSF